MSDAPSNTSPQAPVQPLAPGAWVLTSHWRGPIVRVEKVTAKRIAISGRGYIEPRDVRAIFATVEAAVAGLNRYREAWREAQAELATYASARLKAIAEYDAAEQRLRAAAWEAAGQSPESTSQDGSSPQQGEPSE